MDYSQYSPLNTEIICLPNIKPKKIKLKKETNLNKSYDVSDISKLLNKNKNKLKRASSGLVNTNISNHYPNKRNYLQISRENEISIIKPTTDYKIIIIHNLMKISLPSSKKKQAIRI